MVLDAKLLKPMIFNVNGDSLPGPLIIGTFEKRAPGPVSRAKLGFDLLIVFIAMTTKIPRGALPYF